MKRLLIIAVALLTMLALAVPVAAITNGAPTEDHPEVVLILMEVDGAPAWRCTGALMSPTIVLTAGHCAGAPDEFSGMRVFTEADVEGGIGTSNFYPFGDGDLANMNTIEVKNWAAHPDYPDFPFFFNDVGVLELAQAYDIPAGNYASLPPVDYLDQFKTKRGKHKLVFNAVGYGLQRINPVFVESERVRYEASPKLIQINVPGFTGDFSLLLSNNHSTGGTCFGDSGGPNYIGDGEDRVVGAVTSFGVNGNCAGTGGVFRVDRQNVQDFIEAFTVSPYTP